MIELSIRRQRILRALCEDAYRTRKDIFLCLNPSAAEPVMPDSDQKSLALLVEAGLIEVREKPGRLSEKLPRWEYRRTSSGTRLLGLLELDELFALTPRRQRLVQALSEKFYLTRREICGFISPDLPESSLVMSASDQESLALLGKAGFVDARREPGYPNPAMERWLYRRTEKGTELLNVLGIEPEA